MKQQNPPENASDAAVRPRAETAPAAPGSFRDTMRRLGPAGPLAIVAATLPLITAGTILAKSQHLAPWLRDHHTSGLLLYIGVFIILGGFALLPTWAHSILGGWAFGFAVGFPAAMISFVGASLLAFAIGKWAAGQRVVAMVEEHEKARVVYNALLRSGFRRALLIITLVRLSPNSPFAITNLALAAARVRLSTFILGTLLGLAPRTAIAVYFGSRVSTLDLETPKWMWAAGIAVTLAILGIIAQIAKRALAQVTRVPGDTSTPPQ